MGDLTILKAAVAAVIRANGNQEITGQVLQNTLTSIINTFGTGAQYMGIATPSTNPGTPDAKVYYIASTNGTYPNFGGITVNNEVVILVNMSGSWAKQSTGFATIDGLNYVISLIGELSNLSTEDKTSLVNAINEVLVSLKLEIKNKLDAAAIKWTDDINNGFNIRRIKGITTKPDDLNSASDMGIYYMSVNTGYAKLKGTGLLSVGIDFSSPSIVYQTFLSTSVPVYDSDGTIISFDSKACILSRSYRNGTWTQWKEQIPELSTNNIRENDKTQEEINNETKKSLNDLAIIVDKAPTSYDSKDETTDLDISDDDGDVIAEFANGHVRTKNFDSSNVATKNELIAVAESFNNDIKDIETKINNIPNPGVQTKGTDPEEGDLDISDENGNVILNIANGHVRTKNFDSSNVFNPWKGKTMLCMGASSIGGQDKGTNYTKYYGYPLRTCEVLGMNLINRMQYPRIYACGGNCYKYVCTTDSTKILYTDLTPTDFNTLSKTEIDYYHFQKTRGDRNTDYEFVSYISGTLTVKDNGTQYTFTISNGGAKLSGLFNLGSSATIQEFIDSDRRDRKGESFENFLLNSNIDLLVISDQGIQVDAVGKIDSQIVPLMRRGTLQRPHYYYSDGVSLADRRNSNCGSILFLIDKFLSNNPNGRVIYCQDGMQPINGDGRDEFGVLKNSGYKRFQWTAYMCAKFGIPFLAHSTKIQQTYLTKDIWIAPDNIHPSDECFKIMGEMFAGELLAGTNDISFMMYNFQLNQ